MTVYERSLFLVSSLFYQHVKESGKFKPWVLLRVTQTHEFWVMHVLIFRPLSMSNHTHTLTWITPWIEYVTFVSVVMSAQIPTVWEIKGSESAIFPHFWISMVSAISKLVRSADITIKYHFDFCHRRVPKTFSWRSVVGQLRYWS